MFLIIIDLNIFQNFVAGGISGVISRSITSPLDVVKISSQVGTIEGPDGFKKSIRSVYASEGLGAFFKGNMTACIRLFPFTAIQFTVFDQVRKRLDGGDYSKDFISGSIGGVVATLATYPLDMIKTRMTTNKLRNGQPFYLGIFDAIKKIAKQEGILTFYKGILPTLLGVIPYSGGTFALYNFIKNIYPKPFWKMDSLDHFICGCLTAAFIQTLTYPFDLIRKKMQAQSNSVPQEMKPNITFTGMFDAFRKTFKKSGILGFWAGTTANLLKIIVHVGIIFASFESFRRVFLWYNGYTQNPQLELPKPGIDQNLSSKELKKWYKENYGDQNPRMVDTSDLVKKSQK